MQTVAVALYTATSLIAERAKYSRRKMRCTLFGRRYVRATDGKAGWLRAEESILHAISMKALAAFSASLVASSPPSRRASSPVPRASRKFHKIYRLERSGTPASK